jgi:hypothetical protein
MKGHVGSFLETGFCFVSRHDVKHDFSLAVLNDGHATCHCVLFNVIAGGQ